MEGTIRNIRVFISSPGDVAPERDALEQVIRSLNLMLRSSNVQLEPLRWETHGRPALGNPQENRFAQMGAYDFFVGIFWRRFGPPNGREESGSESEFRDAYARWQEDNSRPVMMYFCERDKQISVDVGLEAGMEELKQAAMVQAFKEEVGDLGLFWTYKEIEEFEELVQRHLYNAAKERIETPEIKVPAPPEPAPLPGPLDDLPLPEMGLPNSPYHPLQYFERDDARVFFGRGHDIRRLYDALGPKKEPVVLFYGESGVGKSSLLFAGLLPRIEADSTTHYIRRDRDLGLAGTLAAVLGCDSTPEAIAKAWKAAEADKPLIVFLDQVEECFTRPRAEGAGKELAAFVDVLHALFGLRSKRPQGRLVLSFRKEWTPDIEQRLEEGKIRHENVFLERLKLQGIIEVVCGPVSSAALKEKYKITVEEDLPEIIAANLLEDRESPVAPTLSILLAKMWDEAKKKSPGAPVFGVELYRDLKDKGLLLSDFVDEQLEKIEEWNPEVAESGLALDVLFYHTTDQGTAETRTLEQLKAEYAHRQEVIAPLLKKCIETNLFFAARGEDDEGNELPATRLAHDTLAPIIRKRHRESDRPGQRARRVLQLRAEKWKDGNTGQVLDKDSLEEVEAGLNGMRVLREEESRLIDASHKKQEQIEQEREAEKRRREEKEREREREKKRRRMQLIGMSVAFAGSDWGCYLAAYQFVAAGNMPDPINDRGDLIERSWCSECYRHGGEYSVADSLSSSQYCQGADFESLIDRYDEDQFSLIPAATFMMGSDSLYLSGTDTLFIYQGWDLRGQISQYL